MHTLYYIKIETQKSLKMIQKLFTIQKRFVK